MVFLFYTSAAGFPLSTHKKSAPKEADLSKSTRRYFIHLEESAVQFFVYPTETQKSLLPVHSSAVLFPIDSGYTLMEYIPLERLAVTLPLFFTVISKY